MSNRCQVCGTSIEKGILPVVIQYSGLRFYSHLDCISNRIIVFNLETFKRLRDNGGVI